MHIERAAANRAGDTHVVAHDDDYRVSWVPELPGGKQFVLRLYLEQQQDPRQGGHYNFWIDVTEKDLVRLLGTLRIAADSESRDGAEARRMLANLQGDMFALVCIASGFTPVKRV